MDIQFLPDVAVTCPDCGGLRYAREADAIRYTARDGRAVSLPQLMACTVDQARELFRGVKKVEGKAEPAQSAGAGLPDPGEGTPALSGGEAQRLKIAFEMGRPQDDALLVFDEPTIGLHPLDIRTLIGVFEGLLQAGATVVVIEHDLDMMANADYMVDMGPGGGQAGGRLVAGRRPGAGGSLSPERHPACIWPGNLQGQL